MTKILHSNERIQWVDAMRGFSMLIVVLGHVFLSMGIGGYSSFISSLLLTFRMPLFFFVSGFFSYRVIKWWNKNRLLDIFKRKFQAQIISMILFCAVYQYVIQGGVDLSHGFGGYWFTIVLFQMWLVYLLFSLTSRLIKKDVALPLMVVASVVCLYVIAFNKGESWLWEFLCWENLTKYFQFFTFGLVLSKYRDYLWSLLQNDIVVITSICGWIVCMMLWYSPSFMQSCPLLYSVIHDVVVRYCGLMTVVIMFFGSASKFSDESRMSRLLRFIGRRTLDIYMIHYFLIPDLSFFKPWISTGNMIVFQLLIGIAVTVMIVALSLLVSSILRRNRYMESWLFGVRVRAR